MTPLLASEVASKPEHPQLDTDLEEEDSCTDELHEVPHLKHDSQA